MKVLFACHRLPYPPKRGGKIRPFNIIRHLTESGHRVTVASLARSDAELEEGRDLSQFCESVLVGSIGQVGAAAHTVSRLATLTPSSMGYFYSRDLHSKVRRALRNERFDLVFAHCSSAAQYLSAASGIPSVIDFGDMDSKKWQDYSSFKPFPLSLGYKLEAAKLERAERNLARRFSLSTCTTRAELETLRDYRVANDADWFPNGVDSDFFSPTGSPYDRDTVCFIGRMDYYPNQQAMLRFCTEVLPLIQSRRPTTKLTIVGAEPSAEIRKLAERPGVTVTGTVPDVRDHVRAAAITVAPLLIARGTQNKILESMAMGVPVICSSLAAQGVDAITGQHLLTADSADAWADSVIRLLDSEGERTKLATAGRDRVLTHHNWQASMKKLDGIMSRVVETGQ